MMETVFAIALNSHIETPGPKLEFHIFQTSADMVPNEGVVMEITAIQRAAPNLHAPDPAIPVDRTSQQREVVQAIKALNGTEMFGAENELRYQQDPETHRLVVKVVNRKTQDVVSQVPAEYILRLAEDLKRK